MRFNQKSKQIAFDMLPAFFSPFPVPFLPPLLRSSVPSILRFPFSCFRQFLLATMDRVTTWVRVQPGGWPSTKNELVSERFYIPPPRFFSIPPLMTRKTKTENDTLDGYKRVTVLLLPISFLLLLPSSFTTSTPNPQAKQAINRPVICLPQVQDPAEPLPQVRTKPTKIRQGYTHLQVNQPRTTVPSEPAFFCLSVKPR